jgi:hypothetical protein
MLWHAEEFSHTKIGRRHLSTFEDELVQEVLYLIGRFIGISQFCSAYLPRRPQTPLNVAAL